MSATTDIFNYCSMMQGGLAKTAGDMPRGMAMYANNAKAADGKESLLKRIGKQIRSAIAGAGRGIQWVGGQAVKGGKAVGRGAAATGRHVWRNKGKYGLGALALGGLAGEEYMRRNKKGPFAE